MKKQFYKKWYCWLIIIIVVATVVSTYNKETLPKYEIALIDDANLGKIIRETLHIVVTEELFTEEDLYNIAVKETNKHTSKNKINALAIGFYKSESEIGNGYTLGYVEYVPNGNWADAVNVVAGDYSTFQYVNKIKPITN